MAPTTGELLVAVNAMSTDMDRRFNAIREEIERRFNKVDQQLDKIDRDVTDDYVTYKEFRPVRNIVYGMVAVVLGSFLGSIAYWIKWGSQ